MRTEICIIQSQIEQLEKALSFIRLHIENQNFSSLEKMQIEVALEEAIVNIIHHSCSSYLFAITIQIRFLPEQIEFTLMDPAPCFNPLEEERSAEEGKVGGAGIILIKKCMDDLYYRYEAGMNILTLLKNLKG